MLIRKTSGTESPARPAINDVVSTTLDAGAICTSPLITTSSFVMLFAWRTGTSPLSFFMSSLD